MIFWGLIHSQMSYLRARFLVVTEALGKSHLHYSLMGEAFRHNIYPWDTTWLWNIPCLPSPSLRSLYCRDFVPPLKNKQGSKLETSLMGLALPTNAGTEIILTHRNLFLKQLWVQTTSGFCRLSWSYKLTRQSSAEAKATTTRSMNTDVTLRVARITADRGTPVTTIASQGTRCRPFTQGQRGGLLFLLLLFVCLSVFLGKKINRRQISLWKIIKSWHRPAWSFTDRDYRNLCPKGLV